MTISQSKPLRKEGSFSVFFITYFVVIPTKTYTTLVLTYLYPCMIKLRRKSYNLSQKSLFWTSKQPLAIRSFIASYNVCPWRSQNSARKRKDPITGNSFICPTHRSNLGIGVGWIRGSISRCRVPKEVYGHGKGRVKSIPRAYWGIGKRVPQMVRKTSGKFI